MSSETGAHRQPPRRREEGLIPSSNGSDPAVPAPLVGETVLSVVELPGTLVENLFPPTLGLTPDSPCSFSLWSRGLLPVRGSRPGPGCCLRVSGLLGARGLRFADQIFWSHTGRLVTVWPRMAGEALSGASERAPPCVQGGIAERPRSLPLEMGRRPRGGASCRPGAGDREEGPFASPGAVYICTEDVFPDLRLQQLIAQQRRLRTDVPGDVVDRMKFGDQIFIEHVADVVSVSLAPRSEGRSVRWESRTREPPHGAVSREAPATGHTCKSTWSGTRNSGQTGLT